MSTELFEQRASKTLPVSKSKNPALPGLSNAVECACESAPYLKTLVEQWPGIVSELEALRPEDVVRNIFDSVAEPTFEGLKVQLRQAKQKIHLLCALCDIAGVWDWENVTEVLSDFADMAMRVLIECLAVETGFEANERGAIPGLFVLALGKYGARELNYSSDIDLIVFYDPDHIKIPNPDRAEQTLVRFVRKLMRGFDEITPDGYVFRTDLRLRPDPRSNSVAVSTVTAERYYETLGQNWERAAMIKARFCGGDKAAAEDFIKNVLTPFIWRRSLDYAAIADIHSIKRQIQGSAKPADVLAAGHDLKLGIGGIREIEFFAQVQQLILGGRHRNLRARRTLKAITLLSEMGFVDPKLLPQFNEDYSLLRDLEHRVQMYADEQSHIWPEDSDKREALARLYGIRDLAKFEERLKAVFLRVHETYSALFPGEEDLATTKGSLVFTGVEPEKITLDTLKAFGFERREEVWHQMSDWLGGRIRATRTPRARELLTRMAPRIIESCATTGVPDTAFFNFSHFIANLNAGITLFSMFVNKPEALLALIEMVAIAPPLAEILSAQPGLIDAMVEPDFLALDLGAEQKNYADLFEMDADYETALNQTRRAVHEDQFSLMASLLKLQHVDDMGREFSTIANAAISVLAPQSKRDAERIYGPIEGEFAILGLGKLGGQEMNFKSDIDIMVLYEPKLDDLDQQNRFNKLTRKVVTSLSSVTEAGGLYEVDMALRPSGRSGPLAVNLRAFEKYYAENAWTWEFMALSRARVVWASSGDFSAAVSKRVDHILESHDFNDELAKDILDMHGRLAREKPADSDWDIKGVKGGLRDIEFIAQFLILLHKPGAPRPVSTLDMLALAGKMSWINKSDATFLFETCQLYQRLVQLLAVIVSGDMESTSVSRPAKQLLVACCGCEVFEGIRPKLLRLRNRVSKILDATIKA